MRRTKPMRRSGQGRQPRKPLPRSRKPLVAPGRSVVESLAWDDTCALLYGRCGGRCERCGRPVLGGFDPHHRKLRSQGGGDEPSNLVAICRACHDEIHAGPEAARRTGWMVRRGGDPAAVALVLHDGRTVRLDDDGGYDVCWDAA